MQLIKQLSWLIPGISVKGGVPGFITDKIIKDKEFPFLISFPRTGSHWLRIILEIYTERPLLTRSFLPHKNRKFLLHHTHDLQLNVKRKRVIYLYRNPLDVIYSQLLYYGWEFTQKDQLVFWTQQYAAHLCWWLINEDYTTAKLIVSYEDLKNSPISSLIKICQFLGIKGEENKLAVTFNKVDHSFVSALTSFDKKVVKSNDMYSVKRIEFKEKHKELIANIFSETSGLLLSDKNKLMEAIGFEV